MKINHETISQLPESNGQFNKKQLWRAEAVNRQHLCHFELKTLKKVEAVNRQHLCHFELKTNKLPNPSSRKNTGQYILRSSYCFHLCHIENIL